MSLVRWAPRRPLCMCARNCSCNWATLLLPEDGRLPGGSPRPLPLQSKEEKALTEGPAELPLLAPPPPRPARLTAGSTGAAPSSLEPGPKDSAHLPGFSLHPVPPNRSLHSHLSTSRPLLLRAHFLAFTSTFLTCTGEGCAARSHVPGAQPQLCLLRCHTCRTSRRRRQRL